MDNLPPLPPGATLDQLPDGLPPLPDGATLDQPDTTTVAKTSDGSGPTTPPPSFKSEPSAGGIDPQRFSRFMNGVFKGYAGAEQLASRGLSYIAPETGAAWQQGADARAKSLQDEANEQAKYAGLKPGSTDWWNIAGQVASPINYIGGEGAVAGAKALPLAGKAVEGSNILKGALQGAGMGALQTVDTGQGQEDFSSQKLSQIGLGAGLGGAGTAALGAIGSVVKPALSEAAQKLSDAGIRMTPGQLLGGNTKRLEDIAQSYPFMGQLIRNAREKAADDFQVQGANKALAPIGEAVDKGVAVGPDLIEHTEDKISAAYNRIHPNVSLQIDQPLAADMATIAQKAAGILPDNELNQFQRIIDAQITGKLAQSGGTAPGKVVQSITSEVGRMMKGYASDPSFDKRQLSGFLGDTREAIGNAIARQNPQYAKPLEDANSAWSMYAKIRDAAGSPGGPIGEFSPTQLERAAKKGATAGQKAKGTAPLQDYAAAGKETLPSKVADSGTPERAAMMAAAHMLTGAGHAGAYALAGPGTLVPAASIAALYNPASQYLLRKAITARPAIAGPVREILDRYAPEVAGRLPLLYNGTNQ